MSDSGRLLQTHFCNFPMPVPSPALSTPTQFPDDGIATILCRSPWEVVPKMQANPTDRYWGSPNTSGNCHVRPIDCKAPPECTSRSRCQIVLRVLPKTIATVKASSLPWPSSESKQESVEKEKQRSHRRDSSRSPFAETKSSECHLSILSMTPLI